MHVWTQPCSFVHSHVTTIWGNKRNFKPFTPLNEPLQFSSFIAPLNQRQGKHYKHTVYYLGIIYVFFTTIILQIAIIVVKYIDYYHSTHYENEKQRKSTLPGQVTPRGNIILQYLLLSGNTTLLSTYKQNQLTKSLGFWQIKGFSPG